MTRRVAITGIGVLTGYGFGTDALWEGLCSGEPPVRDHAARFGGKDWLHYPMAALPAGQIASLVPRLPNQAVVRHERLADDPDLIAIAACVGQALEDAGLTVDREHNDIGVAVTHESPGLADHLQGFFRWGETARAWLRSPHRFDPAEFLYRQKSESVYRLHSFLYVHYLAALFGLHGFSLYNNNACSSGAYALAVAVDRVRAGDVSAMVVAGGDVPEDGTKYRWFRDLGLYSPTGRCRPFRAERDGMVLGSGAAALVVEPVEAARATNRRVYAEWLGAGFTSEGWKITMPDVGGKRYADAIERALVHAGVTAERISLVAPHGVGSGMLDHFEAESLAALYGNGRPGPPLMPVKAALGHTLGGCVLVETTAALLALDAGRVPRMLCCDEPDPKLPIRPAYRDELPSGGVLLKCTNGFAGQNAAVVLRAAQR